MKQEMILIKKACIDKVKEIQEKNDYQNNEIKKMKMN